MTNSEIAKILRETALLYEMKEIEFKPRAYEKAASEIEASPRSAAEIYEKFGMEGIYKNPETKIPAVGQGIAEHIVEILEKGDFQEHKKLKKEIPVDFESLSGIEGVGPKAILKLYKQLGVKNISDLEKAAKAGKIRNLAGFGEKSEKKILEGIEFKKKFAGRFVFGFIMPQVREIENRLKKLKETEKLLVSGSIRRRKETVGDCDILIVSKKPKPVMDFFVKMPEVARVIAHGETKSAIKLSNGLDVDLRVVPPESFGAASQYFTGSKDHNVALRKIAIEKGWKLNEYGLYKLKSQKSKVKTGEKELEEMIAGKTEEEIYEKLGLAYIEPELRENRGEIEAALRQAQGKLNGLPKLIGYGDLKGDLQIQTNWTDGANSIEEMAEEAMKAGLEYIAITDHTKSLAMTGGLDEKMLRKQMKEIDEINSRLRQGFGGQAKFKILKGAEVNILKDGTLDIKDEALAELDFVGAAVHSHFNLSRKEQTARIIRAMKNKNVDAIFHPTGRIIGRREPYDVDISEIIKVAKKTGTILEIDAFPDRLDLKDEYVREAVEVGAKLAIDSDAHSAGHIYYLEYGIAQARRGWAVKADIINAWPVDKMLKTLK